MGRPSLGSRGSQGPRSAALLSGSCSPRVRVVGHGLVECGGRPPRVRPTAERANVIDSVRLEPGAHTSLRAAWWRHTPVPARSEKLDAERSFGPRGTIALLNRTMRFAGASSRGDRI